MKKSLYDIGDEIYYACGKILIGTVIGINETRWSDQEESDVTYVVSTSLGRMRRVSQKDVLQR